MCWVNSDDKAWHGNMESVCLITAEPRGKWFGINSAEQGERGSICVCKRVIEYSLITKSECTDSCSTSVCVCVRVCALLLSDRKPFVSLRLAGVYEWKRINGGHRMKGRTHALKLILIQCIVICKERLWLFHTVRERPCSATQIHWTALSTRQQQCRRKAKQSFLLHFSITETYFFHIFSVLF